MIDWISLSAHTPAPVYTERRCTTVRLERSSDGEILKEYRIGQHVPIFDDLASSSRSFYVFTPDLHTFRMSGNPSKFLQGHNLFGSDDLIGLYLESGLVIRTQVGLFPSPETHDSCMYSPPALSRIDLTRSYRFSTHAEARDYIRFVAGTARTRHGAADLFGSETAYFGKRSRRWSFKIYDKFAEYRKNSKRADYDSELASWSEGVVRFELCLRGQELLEVNNRLLLRQLNNYNSIWQDYYNRIEFNENVFLKKDIVMNNSDLALTNLQKGYYVRWECGEDLRSALSKPTFYRVRKGIFNALGVDISLPPEPKGQPDDKPALKSILEPSGWDPEPLEHRIVRPRSDLKASYGFKNA